MTLYGLRGRANLRRTRYCTDRKIDAKATLEQCDPAQFKVYLVWRVKNSRIKKESSVMTYWKILSMLFAQETASYMVENVLYDIRNVGPRL